MTRKYCTVYVSIKKEKQQVKKTGEWASGYKYKLLAEAFVNSGVL